jgi:4-hydroxybenzoate polyprenyltransferase
MCFEIDHLVGVENPVSVPLCIDLDGTLCRTDTLWEGFFRLALKHPLLACRILMVLRHGRHAFKCALGPHIRLSVESLPWNEAVVALGQRAHAEGRRVVLVSASPHSWVQTAGSYFPFFDETLGTTPEWDLKAEGKASALVDRFGEKGFDYVGNSRDDFAVWQHSRCVLNADSSPHFQRIVSDQWPDALHVSPARPPFSDWLRMLRLHQWSKNLLLFLPLLTAHRWNSAATWSRTLLAFGAFSLVASAIYVWNDLTDLDHDRQSVSKRHRPLAAGALMLSTGLITFPLLLLAGLTLGWTLERPDFFLAVLAYAAVALAYSSGLKSLLAGDVLILAGLYTLRLYAGACASEVPLSIWLLAFSTFTFLSLALSKRCAELLHAQESEKKLPGRAYTEIDAPVLQSLGIASAFASILILALYVNSPDVMRLYHHPAPLWGLCLLHTFWMNRLWLLTRRGAIPGDPVAWALRDAWTYGVVLGAALLMAWATPR